MKIRLNIHPKFLHVISCAVCALSAICGAGMLTPTPTPSATETVTPSATATPTPSVTPSPTGLPDLILYSGVVSPYISVETFTPPGGPVLNVFDPWCDVVEGCTQAGTRRLLRFTTETRNIGAGDLNMGSPATNPNFVFEACHGHYHFEGFADYRLKNAGGLVMAGFKSSFCLLDYSRFDPDANPFRVFNGCDSATDPQGIQAGWKDVYTSNLPCQYIDITNVPPGSYTLELEVNPDLVIVESNYANNTIQVPAIIPSLSPTPTQSPTASPTNTPTPVPSASPTVTPSPTVSPTPFNDADMRHDTIPDAMAPGQSLGVGITIRNTGNTTWTSEGANPWALGVVSDGCGLSASPRISVPFGLAVTPGMNFQFIGQFTAPLAEQECQVELRMVQEFVEWFGESLVANVSVQTPVNSVRDWEGYQ